MLQLPPDARSRAADLEFPTTVSTAGMNLRICRIGCQRSFNISRLPQRILDRGWLPLRAHRQSHPLPSALSRFPASPTPRKGSEAELRIPARRPFPLQRESEHGRRLPSAESRFFLCLWPTLARTLLSVWPPSLRRSHEMLADIVALRRLRSAQPPFPRGLHQHTQWASSRIQGQLSA